MQGQLAKEENRVQSSTSEGLKDSKVSPPAVKRAKKNSKVPPPAVKGAKAPSAGKDAEADQSSKSEDDLAENGNSPEEGIKKSEKILPCPRCNSMDTKFCYFNNYNVNQPRHFCKNCQRHWTAGGTMRNVPVGAGRRKNKNVVASQLQYQTGETIQSTRVEFPSDIHPNGLVCSFNPDTPMCESMLPVLNVADKTMRHDSRNVFHQHGEAVLSTSDGSRDSGHDHANGSSVTVANSGNDVGQSRLPELISDCHSVPSLFPYFPAPPWAYPWHSVQWTVQLPPATVNSASLPIPLYSMRPPAHWGCAVPSGWNVPWPIPPIPTASQSHTSPSSSPKTLGKHSRDGNASGSGSQEQEMRKEGNNGTCIWAPKTMRINDPGEAAKSSIWTTMSIQNNRVDSIGGNGLFKAFQSQTKCDDKGQAQETSAVLQSNPAALSRSLSFHESS